MMHTCTDALTASATRETRRRASWTPARFSCDSVLVSARRGLVKPLLFCLGVLIAQEEEGGKVAYMELPSGSRAPLAVCSREHTTHAPHRLGGNTSVSLWGE